jgi:ribosomal protein S18 acetylase RimI-like enzyme
MKENPSENVVTIDEYLKDPCRILSIPYFKHIQNPNPDHVIIQHQDEVNFRTVQYDQAFFRLIHHLSMPIQINHFLDIQDVNPMNDISEVVHFINHSYSDLSVNETYIQNLINDCTYRKDLWIWLIYEGTRVALALNAFDEMTKEGTLEWIQVKSEYRGQGFGLQIVLHSLNRLKKYANFVTVSGQVDNKTKPERLYRKAGFTGNDIWYIQYLSKEKE